MTTEIMQKAEKRWAETPPSSPALRHLISEFVERQTWLDKLADPIQGALRNFYGRPGQPRRKLKNILNGTWLGHSFHPVLTDIPLGSWSATMLLDLVWLNDRDNVDLAYGADLTLLLGMVGALGSTVTGMTDWSDLNGTDRRVGLMHGLLNGGITLLYIGSTIVRGAGLRRTGILLSSVGYLTSLFSAYLGGDLVSAKGVGVNHIAWEGGPDNFVPVINLEDLPENQMTRVDVAGTPAILVKQGQSLFAIGATCTHMGGPLDQGKLEAGLVECPWHGSRFRLSDGSVETSPAVYPEPTFDVRLRDGKVELRRQDHA